MLVARDRAPDVVQLGPVLQREAQQHRAIARYRLDHFAALAAVDEDLAEPTNWSGELLLYLQEYDSTAAAALTHDEMGKAARDLVPDDVGKVFAGAFQITRNRRGNLAITRRAA
ncbi:hypothetical protein [Bradyrhizobium sp. AZCC 2289]|uniref:hypothetical protein n=1 Tax=Bradyrhizobium sp. AZCC 2289 TaxID=3117026 RepID=UPI002FF1FD9B